MFNGGGNVPDRLLILMVACVVIVFVFELIVWLPVIL